MSNDRSDDDDNYIILVIICLFQWTIVVIVTVVPLDVKKCKTINSSVFVRKEWDLLVMDLIVLVSVMIMMMDYSRN